MNNVNLEVNVGIKLKNPVMPASGTFDEGLSRVFDFNCLGALVAKTFTEELREGNPLPRVVERPCGMINAIGIPSKGLEHFLKHTLPYFKRYDVPFVASISAPTADEFERLAAKITVEGVDVIEANISCPNIEADGKAFAMSADTTEMVVKKLRGATNLPLWVKLTPNTGNIVDVAKAAEYAGADAAVVANTILAMAIDINTFRPSLGNIMGGYSGPAVKPIVLRQVFQCAQAVKIPIIGCGGISTAEDAIEYMLAGASAVQVGTATFIQPNAMPAIIKGIAEFCAAKNIPSVSGLTGAVIKGMQEMEMENAKQPV